MGIYYGLFKDFLRSADSLHIYDNKKLVFASSGNGLAPLLEYLKTPVPASPDVVIFDKIVGNAAALLAIKAGCHRIYSPLGSTLAEATLKKYKCGYVFISTVPFIVDRNGKLMCPRERLSLNKTPDEFYALIQPVLVL